MTAQQPTGWQGAKRLNDGSYRFQETRRTMGSFFMDQLITGGSSYGRKDIENRWWGNRKHFSSVINLWLTAKRHSSIGCRARTSPSEVTGNYGCWWVHINITRKQYAYGMPGSVWLCRLEITQSRLMSSKQSMPSLRSMKGRSCSHSAMSGLIMMPDQRSLRSWWILAWQD